VEGIHNVHAAAEALLSMYLANARDTYNKTNTAMVLSIPDKEFSSSLKEHLL